MPQPIDNRQASLALTQFIPLQGIFPSSDPDPHADPGGVPLGAIRTFAGNFVPAGGPTFSGGAAGAEGQLVPINQNTPLFSLLGTMYGGNGTSNFALPDLDGRTIIGATQLGLASRPAIGSSEIALTRDLLPSSLGGSSEPFDNYQPSLPVTYLIRTAGVFPTPGGTGGVDFIGQVVPFAGNFVPAGFLQAAGQLLQIAEYIDLFTLIGTTYGGDGVTTFGLPDLRGRTIVGDSPQLPIGATDGDALATLSDANLPVSAGGSAQPIDNHEPSVALTYLIALEGIFPPMQGGSVDPTQQYLGEVVAFAGNFVPDGWVKAEGQLLSISQNTALFSLLGTQYGGDGIVNFALPDLSDRAAIGTGDAADVGDILGSNNLTVLSANIDFHFGAATGDFNGNGTDDVLWKNALTGVTHEWLMSPAGGVAAFPFTPAAPGWNAVATGDFNGDGTDDILWKHAASGATSEWLMSGGSLASNPGTPGAAGWNLVATGDFNNDGTDDLIWQNSAGVTSEWLMAPGGGVAAFPATPSAAGWSLIAHGDFNGDGTDDLMWKHASGATSEWLMSGGAMAVNPATPGAAGWDVVATGDFNHDGTIDLLWKHAASGATSEWLMAPTGGVGSAPALPSTAGWNLVASGDFSGDGTDDLMWQNATTGATSEWLMAGGGFAGNPFTPAAPGYDVAATGDLNGDAIIDLLWQNALNGATAEWLMAPGGGVGSFPGTPLT